MRTVVFVAPFLRENTVRFLRAFLDLDDARVAAVGQDPVEYLPRELRDRLAGYEQVRDCLDPEGLGRAVRSLRLSLGGVDRLTGALEQLQIPVAQVRDRLGIPGLTEEAARNFRDKDRMKEVLRRAGVPVARSRLIRSEVDLSDFLYEVGFPIVLKPPAGLGAQGTFRVSDPREARLAFDATRPSPYDPVQAEEFVSGRENTCETVFIEGQAVWRSGTRYLPGPLEVLQNPWMQYCVLLPREVEPAFERFHPINDAALHALGLHTGLSHLEWFERDQGPVVSEVGARPPGAMIMPLMSQAHEVDMVAAWARLIAHDAFDPPQRRFAAGCAFFRGQGSGRRVIAVHGLDQAHEEVGDLVVEASLPRPGQPRSSGYEGEGWAVVRHERTAEVIHALRRLVSLVRVEYG